MSVDFYEYWAMAIAMLVLVIGFNNPSATFFVPPFHALISKFMDALVNYG